MVLFNYSTREITAKIVYYGPGLCGKTSNLQYIHENLPDQVRGKMLSLATKTDRTLFFDFLPIDLGEIRGMKTRVQLYTVPGQVFYNETRKLVLKGADGIVFVADSQETMIGANVESFKNLEENLKGHGLMLADIPHVIQFNKRDLPRLASIEDLNAAINRFNAPFYESVAVTGIGVQDTLKAIVKLVLLHLTRKYDPKGAPAPEERAAPAAASARPVAVPVAAKPAFVPPPVQASPVELPQPAARAPLGATPSLRSRGAGLAMDAGTGIPDAPFRADEIDGLIDEVGDTYDRGDHGSTDNPPMAAAAKTAAQPSTPHDEGTWMGSAEDEVSSSLTGSEPMFDATSGLEDLPDAPIQDSEVAPALLEDGTGNGLEVDRGFDPDWASQPPQAPSRLRSPEPSRASVFDQVGSKGTPGPIESHPPVSGEMVLTEVVTDTALFEDPNLEVASLEPGEAREVVVPVLLGTGAEARRFKLSILLRLDPVE